MEKPNIAQAILSFVMLLADKPERVEVAEIHDDNTTFFNIYVDTTDKGTVIGRGGKHIHALRTWFMAVAAKHRLGRIRIEIDSKG